MDENMKIKTTSLLSTRNQNYYFYDREKKRFQLCHPLLYQAVSKNTMNPDPLPVEVKNQGGGKSEDTEYYYQKYLLLKNNGYFSQLDQEGVLGKKMHPDDVEGNIANTMEVVFSVTNRCNMDCRYCGYGKFYEGPDKRKTGKKELDIRLARRLLDYLSGLWNSPLNKSHQKVINIGFYGGEPLLNIAFIEKVVDYMKQLKLKHNGFKFSMTTNGTLIEKYMDFLYENNFDLSISLDGNEANNAYRVFKNGKPAYHAILSNIDALKNKYPGYYDSHVNFISVLHNKNSVSEVYRYYKNYHHKKPTINGLNSSGIKASGKAEFWEMYHNVEQSAHESEDYSLIAKDLFDMLPNIKDVIYLLTHLNEYFFSDYNDLIYEKAENQRFPTGTCVPFSKKILLSEDGNLFPCERIDEGFALGNVTLDRVRLDSEKIARKYNTYYDKARKMCGKCHNADMCKECMFYLNIHTRDPLKCHGFMDEKKRAQYLSSFVSHIEENPYTTADLIRGGGNGRGTVNMQFSNGDNYSNDYSDDYWFFIDTYVHIKIKNDSLLLYNSLTGKALQYVKEDEILKLVKRMLLPKNQQVALLTQKSLQNPVISQFVMDVRSHFMGDIIAAANSKGKPVQMMPVVTVEKDVKFLNRHPDYSIGDNVLSYLTEIFLYINNECHQKCHTCRSAYKQFTCCTVKKKNLPPLDTRIIKEMLDQTKSASIKRLNVLGGDIFKYPSLAELKQMLKVCSGEIIFHTHFLNLFEKDGSLTSQLKLFANHSAGLKVYVTSPINQVRLKTVLDFFRQAVVNHQFVFIIQDEEEFREAESLISLFNIEQAIYRPFYNGNNQEFFRENIFVDEDQILKSRPSLKYIYRNSSVNPSNFGRLTILSNGHIYANVNASRLGILGKDSIYDVLYKEVRHGKSWRRVRKNLEPCKRCTFEALCPPLSNYTYAIGRNNLCGKRGLL